MEETARISGVVQNIIYVNHDNSYTVLEVGNESDTILAVGILPDVRPGERLTALGKWTVHRDYGRQFQIDSVEISAPENTSHIRKYLASGAIPGVGPIIAERIIESFGDEALSVIENDYFRLAEVKGISISKAEEISRVYREQFGLRNAMLFLQKYSITPAECIRIYKKYGVMTNEVIRNDPYVLSTRIHLRFDRVDAIAERLGVPRDSQKRIMAGVLFVMTHNCTNGHTFIPRGKIVPVAVKLLGCNEELVADAIDLLVESEDLYSEEFDGTECLFLPDCYRAESYIAQRLCLLNRCFPEDGNNHERLISRLEKRFSINYADEQKRAISCAVQRGVLVLTGGPGTGKTTVIRGIVEAYEDMGIKVCLTAPTGRAAKQMAELTGHEAKTVHRLLEAGLDEYGASRFMRNDGNLLDYSAVILDETSMVDIFLFESLLRALKPHCRIVLVGDADQLPSVGPGNILKDIIDSGLFPCVHLDHIFRQSASSMIITNSHRVVSGEMPVLDCKDADFFFLPCSSDYVAVRNICDLVSRRLPKAYGFDPMWDIQIICPSKVGLTGTVALNRSVQEVLNPADLSKNEISLHGTLFRQGDKVMQIRNNYDLMWTDSSGESGSGIFNGDIGVIESIDSNASVIIMRVEDKLYQYPFTMTEDLDLAYAITVHKSQGSEFDAVVIPVCSLPQKLMYRNLFYTAITRAKKMVLLIGSADTISSMVNNTTRNARFTALAEFLYREA